MNLNILFYCNFCKNIFLIKITWHACFFKFDSTIYKSQWTISSSDISVSSNSRMTFDKRVNRRSNLIIFRWCFDPEFELVVSDIVESVWAGFDKLNSDKFLQHWSRRCSIVSCTTVWYSIVVSVGFGTIGFAVCVFTERDCIVVVMDDGPGLKKEENITF